MSVVLRRLMSGIGLWAVLGCYVVYVAFDRTIASMLVGFDVDVEPLEMLDFGVMVAMSVMLAIACGWRVAAFHPGYRPAYAEWLRRTPWSTRLPLPLGPIGPTVWDAAVALGVVAWLSWWHGADVRIPLLAALAGFAIPLLPTANWVILSLSVVGLPLLWYPHLHLTVTVVLLAAWLPVLVYSGRRELAKFPFGDDAWKRSPLDELRVKAKGAVGWPIKTVGPEYEADGEGMGDRSQTVVTLCVLTCVLAWYVHAIVWCMSGGADVFDIAARDEEAWRVLLAVLLLGPAGAAMIRLLVYQLNRRAPISLTGRLATGRWLVPGWDVAWLAPLATVVAGYAGGAAMFVFGWPVAVGLPVWVLATLLPLALIGPSMEAWKYTGHYGYLRSANIGGTQVSTGKTKSIGDIKIKLG